MTQHSTSGGLLNDQSLQQYMQQQQKQQFWNMLMQVGQGLLSANRQGQPPLRALASGLARGGSARSQGTGGLLDWMKMRQYTQGQQDRQQKQEREQRQYNARDMLSSGALASARHPAPAGLLAGRSLLDREYGGLLGQGYSEAVGKARVAEAFPKEPKYGTPVTVQGPNGPELVRFPQGSGAPVPVQGYSPYTKPGEGPAVVQTADAYRRASKQVGITVSQLEALQWARTSVSKSPSDIFTGLYTALVRGFASPEEAKSTAEQMTRYIMSIRAGGLQSEPKPSPSAAAESVGGPSLYERGKEFLGFTSAPGPAQAATRPGVADNPLIPRRKPSLEGVRLPLPSSGPGYGTSSTRAGSIPGRPPLDALSPAQKLDRLSEQRPGKLQEPLGRAPVREVDSPKRPLPLTAAGKLDAKRLISGQIYEASDLTLWLWNGKNFKEVAG